MDPGQCRGKPLTAEDLEGRPDLEWLDLGMRAGLSLLELHEFRCRDLLAFAEIRLALGEEGQTAREPTQADIDAFLGR